MWQALYTSVVVPSNFNFAISQHNPIVYYLMEVFNYNIIHKATNATYDVL